MCSDVEGLFGAEGAVLLNTRSSNVCTVQALEGNCYKLCSLLHLRARASFKYAQVDGAVCSSEEETMYDESRENNIPILNTN
jgi:hypothetical protein